MCFARHSGWRNHMKMASKGMGWSSVEHSGGVGKKSSVPRKYSMKSILSAWMERLGCRQEPLGLTRLWSWSFMAHSNWIWMNDITPIYIYPREQETGGINQHIKPGYVTACSVTFHPAVITPAHTPDFPRFLPILHPSRDTTLLVNSIFHPQTFMMARILPPPSQQNLPVFHNLILAGMQQCWP